MKNNFEFTIVIPVYNEERRIRKTIIDILARMSKISQSYELVFVNDGSIDRTINIINRKLRGSKVNYQIKSFIQNRGKGAAIKEGILSSNGKHIVLFDADNSTKIDELNNLQDELKSYDFIIGSRYVKGGNIELKQSWVRRAVSRTGNLLIRFVLNLPYADTQCGFKILENKTAKKIAVKMQIQRWGFDIEMLTIAKLKKIKVKEVPVSWANSSDSKLNTGRAAWQTFKELLLISKNYRMRLYD